MSNYKKMLILFILFILVLAIVFYLYREEIAIYIQKYLERSGSALEDNTLPQVSDIDEIEVLNTETITQSRFRVLKDQVPSSFLEDRTATSTSIGNKSLFLRP